jgi:hypothetical protein
MGAKHIAHRLRGRLGVISAVLLLGAGGALATAFTSNGASLTLVSACTTPVSLSASPSSPQAAGTTVLWTAAATGCATPQFRFFVSTGSSGWVVAQEWSASPTFSWNTTGLAAGSYLVEAWARSGTSGTLEAQSADVSYTLTAGSPSPCTTPVNLSASPSSPQAAGTAVVWTASATGCATPQFRFFVSTGSSGWTVAQDWNASPTFSWNTTGLAAGTYTFEVWARSGTSGTLEAQSADIPFTLTIGTTLCTTPVTLSASPGSPQTVGTTVLWTASATGCTTPQFRFHVWTASTGWTVAQDWSASPTFSWNTTGLAAGTYTFEVWARSGTSGTLEAQSADVPYTLTTGTTPPPSACADQAAALALQVQRVDSAFSGFHVNLMTLRGQRAAATINSADAMLKAIRDAAVKAIRGTEDQACKKQNDQDEKNNNDENNTGGDQSAGAAIVTTLSVVGDSTNDANNGGDHGDENKIKPTPITFSGDATSIADQAIAAMQVAFNTAQNAPVVTPKPTPTHNAESTKGSEQKNQNQKDHKGGHGD